MAGGILAPKMGIHSGSNGDFHVTDSGGNRVKVGIENANKSLRETWFDRGTARRVAYDILAILGDQADAKLSGS